MTPSQTFSPQTSRPAPSRPSAPTGSGQLSAATVTVADAIAAAVLLVPGVRRLHAGSFGEVATYLPGRRVTGVRITGEVTEVHIVVGAVEPVLVVAERVRSAVQPLVATRVDVYLEDLHAAMPEPVTGLVTSGPAPRRSAPAAPAATAATAATAPPSNGSPS